MKPSWEDDETAENDPPYSMDDVVGYLPLRAAVGLVEAVERHADTPENRQSLRTLVEAIKREYL